MKKVLLIIISLFAMHSYAQVKHTVTKSSVTFKIKHLGFTANGHFSGLVADIQFDPEQLAGSSITASIDASTVNTDNETRDEDLRGKTYFDVANYPKIAMESVSFEHLHGDNYSGTFKLTLKKVTKQVEVPFTYKETGNNAVFNGSFKIKRTDFGVGGSSFLISKDVMINLEVETTK